MTEPSISRLAGIQRSGIREIMELAAGHPGAIHLEVGEPDFETPSHIITAAADAARAGFTKYTASRGIMELREAIADKVLRVNGLQVDPVTDVVVTAGAANGLLVTLAAVVNPGDVVLIPDPGWPNFVGMAKMLGLRVVRYPMRAEHGFQPEPDEVRRIARETGARALIVNSPHNPTGTIVSPDRLVALVELAGECGATLISDECYDQILLDDQPKVTGPRPGADVPSISVFSLSKTYAMTGWRIGYLTGPGDAVADIARIQEAWLSCCSAPVQKAAEAALTGDQSPVGTMVAAYRRRRDLAMSTALECGLDVQRPSGAFYLMVDVSSSGLDGTTFAKELLARGSVAVAPGETFGAQSAGMVRVALAASETAIDTGLRRLADTLADLSQE